jgi:hypothetical protein
MKQTTKPFDWTTLSSELNVTSTPILCKDGTTDFSLSSSNARYDNTKVCANNGGRAENQKNVLNDANNSVSKYVFNQDFEATTRVVKEKAVGDYTENIDYITLKYKFKKGDIFDGKKIPVNAGVNPEARKYDIQITTPKSIKFDGSDYVGQVTYQIDDSLVSEATPFQRNKKYLLIIGALVIGYLAYKKFNK